MCTAELFHLLHLLYYSATQLFHWMLTESQAEFFARFINLPHTTWFDLNTSVLTRRISAWQMWCLVLRHLTTRLSWEMCIWTFPNGKCCLVIHWFERDMNKIQMTCQFFVWSSNTCVHKHICTYVHICIQYTCNNSMHTYVYT